MEDGLFICIITASVFDTLALPAALLLLKRQELMFQFVLIGGI
jgi:hypothetical protein